MTHQTIGRTYEILLHELKAWVRRNEKLKRNITTHDLEYLFEFHRARGLSIDLRRFDKAYYLEVFYPLEQKQRYVDAFVRKVSLVICDSLEKLGRDDITITITVRHMVSEASYWHTFYIDRNTYRYKTKL